VPRIFDNIDQKLLPALQQTLNVSYRADFCVGYFNLRGWRKIDEQIEKWTGGENAQCRLLVGMYRRPQEELQAALGFGGKNERMDISKANKLKKELAAEFRHQLTIGTPTNADEAGLRRLANQLRTGKVQVKLFLRHTLHAKLYLLFREDIATPLIGYMGSSNLTISGLAGQGELNVDVLEQDAANKLAKWFNDRWEDRFCVDISQELIEILEESWAGEKPIPPYHIYLKMAYHLSQEARAGLTEFAIPTIFGDRLFDFQVAAVKIAARHLNQRGGVLIGDVVGLGKTLMATALAKIFEEDYFVETLIICPKNLVKMWEDYRISYGLRAKVLSITLVQQELPDLRRFRLVLIDESHNLRNREGKRYRAIREYIQQNDSRCILLSATPYNKTYLDLSSQLRLFLPEDVDLGIRPERLLREISEVEFSRRHQAGLRTLAAFEKSEYAEDWRELMSLFMVRRTRSFIRDNYAERDPANGRRYLTYADGSRAYFPDRFPKRITFALDDSEADDQYARMYSPEVVDSINDLQLPRYGLANYVKAHPSPAPSSAEQKILEDLSRGGRRLMGFSRTNLFKRLESSGYVFLLSVERHILRNFIFLHALENGLPLPIGTQGAEMLDPRFEDEDAEDVAYSAASLFDDDDGENDDSVYLPPVTLRTEADFQARAAAVYQQYQTRFRRRFRWIRANLFQKSLARNLRADADRLLQVLDRCGEWRPDQDAQLDALHQLITQTHPQEKILVFSQFADTVHYLAEQLKGRGLEKVEGVTGSTADPTELAWRFSPVSNGKRAFVDPKHELRVLIATDVLSEGQNLQDAHIVVNYDLPWAIIRLIQRVGRVDRIGQMADQILAYAFWPADGVERIINLRQRLRQRLEQNREVVGSDEIFFEDEESEKALFDLYHERPSVLEEDEDPEGETDLVSHAYQIWKNATDANPLLRTAIPRMPNVVYSTKAHPSPHPTTGREGVLVYLRTEIGNSALAWMDGEGRNVTESQFAILRAAACDADTPALERLERHHDLVEKAVRHVMSEGRHVGGQLGRPSGSRYKTYTRLKTFVETQLRQSPLLARTEESQMLERAVEQIYQFPLKESAKEKLNRQLRSNVRDEDLAQLVVALFQEDMLCIVGDEEETDEPQIVCSMGLVTVDKDWS
jgi:superfamily II DNA or RNA helicase